MTLWAQRAKMGKITEETVAFNCPDCSVIVQQKGFVNSLEFPTLDSGKTIP